MRKFGTLLSSLKLLVRTSTKGVICVTLAKVIKSLIPAVLALFLEKLVSIVVGGENIQEIIGMASILGGILLCNAVLQSINQIALNAWLFETSNLQLRKKLVFRTSEIPLVDMEKAQTYDSLRFAYNIVANEALPMTLYELLEIGGACITFLSLAVVLFRFHWLLVLMTLLIAVPVFITRLVRGKAMFGLKEKQVSENRRLVTWRGWFTADKTNKEMRATNSGSYIVKRWDALDKQHRNEIKKQTIKDVNSLGFCELLRVLFLLGTIIITIIFALKDMITFGALAGALIAYTQAQNSAIDFSKHAGTLPILLKENKKLLEYLETQKDTSNKSNIGDFESIELKDVAFKYPQSENFALKNITFSFRKGEKIAFVGLNGSGKTTLSKLILGVYPPTEGYISINEIDSKCIDLSSFHKNIGIVPQVVPRFNLTLRDYLCFGEDIDDKVIIKELQRLGFENLTTDLNVQLGKEFSGIELSQGNLQRLAIVKCMLLDANLYILDEPTSSIDPIEESNILRSFLEMTKNKTCLIITHRLGICPFVDRVIVLKDGEIVESGTHSQLLQDNKEYAVMYNQQKSFIIYQ